MGPKSKERLKRLSLLDDCCRAIQSKFVISHCFNDNGIYPVPKFLVLVTASDNFSVAAYVGYRVANRPLFQRTVLYLNHPRPCPLLNLELSFISRAEKNLLQKRKKFAKVQSNRGCVAAQPMENRVLTFFCFSFLFFFLEATMSASSIFTGWPPKKKKMVNT